MKTIANFLSNMVEFLLTPIRTEIKLSVFRQKIAELERHNTTEYKEIISDCKGWYQNK